MNTLYNDSLNLINSFQSTDSNKSSVYLRKHNGKLAFIEKGKTNVFARLLHRKEYDFKKNANVIKVLMETLHHIKNTLSPSDLKKLVTFQKEYNQFVELVMKKKLTPGWFSKTILRKAIPDKGLIQREAKYFQLNKDWSNPVISPGKDTTAKETTQNIHNVNEKDVALQPEHNIPIAPSVTPPIAPPQQVELLTPPKSLRDPTARILWVLEQPAVTSSLGDVCRISLHTVDVENKNERMNHALRALMDDDILSIRQKVDPKTQLELLSQIQKAWSEKANKISQESKQDKPLLTCYSKCLKECTTLEELEKLPTLLEIRVILNKISSSKIKSLSHGDHARRVFTSMPNELFLHLCTRPLNNQNTLLLHDVFTYGNAEQIIDIIIKFAHADPEVLQQALLKQQTDGRTPNDLLEINSEVSLEDKQSIRILLEKITKAALHPLHSFKPLGKTTEDKVFEVLRNTVFDRQLFEKVIKYSNTYTENSPSELKLKILTECMFAATNDDFFTMNDRLAYTVGIATATNLVKKLITEIVPELAKSLSQQSPYYHQQMQVIKAYKKTIEKCTVLAEMQEKCPTIGELKYLLTMPPDGYFYSSFLNFPIRSYPSYIKLDPHLVAALMQIPIFLDHTTILHNVFENGTSEQISYFLNIIESQKLDFLQVLSAKRQDGVTPEDLLLQNQKLSKDELVQFTSYIQAKRHPAIEKK